MDLVEHEIGHTLGWTHSGFVDGAAVARIGARPFARLKAIRAAQVPAAPEGLHRHPDAVHVELRRRAGAPPQHRRRRLGERATR